METKNWSEEQLAIFDAFANGRSHFAVIARAGTGKSTTAAEGICRAPEEKKLYATFNSRNVKEFKDKIHDPRCQIMTLNGLGYRFVLQQWKGVKPDDTVELDRARACADKLYPGRKYAPVGATKQLVDYAKNTSPFAKAADLEKILDAKGIGLEEYQEREGWKDEDVVRIAEASMQLAKTPDAKGRISFNDQIWLPVVMKWIRPWFSLVVIDEAQDMNHTQLILAEGSCKKTGRLVLIGDPRQAIYSWRGAAVGGMERLIEKLRAKTLPLTTTYRCPKKVVELASVFVPDYRAAVSAPDGTISCIGDNKATVVAAINAGDAVISRFNAPLMPLCLEAIRRRKRAYVEGRDVGKTLQSVHDKIQAKDVPAYITALDTWAADRISRVSGDPESDSFKNAIQAIEDQQATLTAIAQDEGIKTVSDIGLRLQSLFQDSTDGTSPGAIVFTSIHKSKGLEFPRVFILAETLKRASWTSNPSEECNLAYVAITRSKSDLVWVGRGGPGGSITPPALSATQDIAK
jgi:UvrD/REP helicase N-terminal domain/UvrD-like helicase C-terminal domain